VGFGDLANGSAAGLLTILRHAGINHGLVVDLGCGSGIWAEHLVRAGYSVVGLDISPAMIQLARNRVPNGEFQVGSFLRFDLPCCGAITALGEVLCYQFDVDSDLTSLHRLFERAYAALKSKGLLIFDVAEVGLDQSRSPSFREGDGWECRTRFEYDNERERLIRHIATVRKVGTLYRRHEESHTVQLYRQADIEDVLHAIGFRVEIVRQYGDYELLHGRVGFVAHKA